ncbi:MAG: FAD-dependent monooxygenase [Gammaproteobacteria bacterium]
MSPPFDIAVVGAGVTGLTAAALAAHEGARVVVVAAECDFSPPHATVMDLRTYALTPAAARVLDYVGAWELLDHKRIGKFDSMSVWDAGSRGRIEFTPPPLHVGPLGWIVEQRNLIAALGRVLTEQGVPVRRQALAACSGANPALLTLADGQHVAARLVIGADGMNSMLRRCAGIEWREESYEQRAIVANVTTTLPHRRIARQRFLPSGPLAFLPLAAPHESSIVWSCTTARAAALEREDDSGFARELAHAIEHDLGDIVAVSARAGYPLGRARAGRLVSGSLVLVGDAAHRLHPLAGQGLNLGLLDVAALFECLGPAAGAAGWPRPAALRRYERWRQSEAQMLLVATDALHRLFQREEFALRWLRGAGFGLTDACRPLKHWFADRAMGNSGDVPRIARAAADTRT